MALIGSINEQGELQGQINGARYLTGVITSASAVGGEIVGMRGLKGDKGDQGDKGDKGDTGDVGAFIAEYGVTTYSEIVSAISQKKVVLCHAKNALDPDLDYYFVLSDYDGVALPSVYTFVRTVVDSQSASFQYVTCDTSNEWSIGSRNLVPVTRTVNGKALSQNITLDASDVGAQETLVSGTNIKTINSESLLGSGNIDIQSGGASAFIAEYGVTTYADVKDAYDEDAIILCTVDDSGNTVICHLAYYDDANGLFYFAQPQSDGFYLAIIASDDTWDDSYFTFASTDTATELRNGLMDALDKQKLDGIASGAEVNVQSDWNEADSTDDAYIKNKPTIPSKTSDLNNDSGFITGGTSTPTADEVAEFDSDAHMNSTDMTTAQVDDFVDGLNVSGGGVVKTNVTPTSGTNYSGYGNCYYEVLGKLVHFHIGIGDLTANTSTKIYTMPLGLRPQTKIFAKGTGGSSLNFSGVELWDNGEIYVTSQSTYCGAELWYFV